MVVSTFRDVFWVVDVVLSISITPSVVVFAAVVASILKLPSAESVQVVEAKFVCEEVATNVMSTPPSKLTPAIVGYVSGRPRLLCNQASNMIFPADPGSVLGKKGFSVHELLALNEVTVYKTPACTSIGVDRLVYFQVPSFVTLTDPSEV